MRNDIYNSFMHNDIENIEISLLTQSENSEGKLSIGEGETAFHWHENDHA
jgi:hypothetical protein